MTTNFDSIQMLETSENCDKFSTSVSYETLFIGATTTGREIKQKKSSLILRKAKFQAIFNFVLSSASGGAGGGKYNRISAFVSMPVLLIRSSREKFFKKNFRDDSSFCFCFAKVKALSFLRLRGASGAQGISAPASCRKAHKRRFLFNLIRNSLEFFRVPRKNMNASFTFGFAKVKVLSFLRLRGASGVQGISAPASCRKAHKRRFLFNSWILHFTFAPFRMTIPALALIFTLFATAESWAACNLTNNDGDIVDESGNYCGTCGADCHWVLDGDGNMKITGSGKMDNYSPNCVAGRNPKCTTEDRPWQKYHKQIKSVDIQGVKNVGTGAFYYIPITNLTLGNTVTSLGFAAFEQHHLQTIELPDSLESISDQALATINNDYTIIIPDTLNVFYGNSLNFSSCKICTNSNIICRGETTKCENIKKKMLEISPDLNFSMADSSNCDTENFYWSGEICARKDENGNISCATGYAEYKNKCWSELPFAKKRWTPAEANEWLHAGNDNFVVITFKK